MNLRQQERGRQVPPTSAEIGAVERTRMQVDRLCWTGILLGLAFTMTNVQSFAAAGAAVWSLAWWAAWLLDPMVSLVLLAVLRAEQVTARYGIRTGGWVRGAKWFTLAATYVMNTWEAFADASAAMVVLHSVPPLVVFVAAEAITDLRNKLSEAAREMAVNTSDVEAPRAVDEQPAGKPRTSSEEYLRRARAVWEPGVSVTPAWIARGRCWPPRLPGRWRWRLPGGARKVCRAGNRSCLDRGRSRGRWSRKPWSTLSVTRS